MDDRDTAYDRQLASVLQAAAGPSRPVDAASIVRALTTTAPRGRWSVVTRRLRGGVAAPTGRGFDMSSALTFVAAGVIVALFGGLLLAGVLTAPQGDDMAPAAVSASPSPITTEELLAGMVTEEVEPGVLRVVNDGVRDLADPDLGFPSHSVDITPDGSVWLSGEGSPHGLFRLGHETSFEDPRLWPPFSQVAPDGSLWAIGDNGVLSFDGERWTRHARRTEPGLQLRALAVGADGTVWVTASRQDRSRGTASSDSVGTVLLRLDDEGSLTAVEDWTDAYAGVVADDEVAVSPDGDVWLIGMASHQSLGAEALLRFDGEGWHLVPGPDGFINNGEGRSIAVGPDGTLWVHTRDPERDEWNETGPEWNGTGLARFDDPGWTTFTEADGVQAWGGQGFIDTDLLKVATDGSVWLNGSTDRGGCDGVDHYDGTTWTSYLQGLCVHDFDVGPDGSVWVRADRYGGMYPIEDVHTYVITPDGATGSE